MAQFLIVRDLLLRQFGAVDYTKRVVVTTDAESGALRQVIHDEGFRDLAVPAGVGGRFSVLTAVGLFPAAVAGLKVDELLAGAAWIGQPLAATPICGIIRPTCWRHCCTSPTRSTGRTSW